MNGGRMEEDFRMVKYHQYCPVARACEVIADRWTPLIVRELLFGSRHFNELQRGLPRIARSLLVARLRHLEDNGVIERLTGARPNLTEYTLTEAGNDLADVIKQLGTWAIKWVFNDPNRDELDPGLFLWKMHQRVDHHELPRRRTVVQFELERAKGVARPSTPRCLIVFEASRFSVRPDCAGGRFRAVPRMGRFC